MKSTHLFWVFCAGLALSACQTNRPQRIDYDPAFDAYLSAFTGGEISKKSNILVQFAQAVGAKDRPVPAGLLSLEPSAAGQARWADARTLEFVPSGDLRSGQVYTASVDMAQLFEGLAPELRNFRFQFKTKDQFVNVSPSAARSMGEGQSKRFQLQGQLTTHDAEDPVKVRKILAAYNGNTEMPITWTGSEGNTHYFVIDSLQRQSSDYQVSLNWNGNALGATRSSGTLHYNIPASDKFVLNNTYRYNNPEQHIVLEFSDNIDPNQDLQGLIALGGASVKTIVSGNQVKLYPNTKLSGKVQLTVNQSIRNVFGSPLQGPATETLTFSDELPKVELVGKGNIIPKSKKMPVVFKTINLNAVDIRIIKIKENNIQQFFQVNRIEGNQELKRVGKEVLRKTLALDKTPGLSLSEWTHHSLDLAELIEPEPGAIYELALGFRPSHILYQCADMGDLNDPDNPAPDMLRLPSDWDKPGYEYSYWDYYGEDYDYEDLETPCKRPFYNESRMVRRNILASDLGIIAKQGDNGNFFVVNNLQTLEPMQGVVLEFYDFHQDLITTAKTGKDGSAQVELPKKPFMLIAKHQNQRGYLRLDDGSALSLSRFDVQGTRYVKGLKGYIYGERGVWRPGDELFLNFILEDRDGTLPAGHPVQFALRDPQGAVVARRTNTQGINGIYNFTCSTAADAPTGNYTATVQVGGATFSKTLKIETIKPNRLKLALDFGKNVLAADDKNLSGTLRAHWLSGAAARGLKADVELTLLADRTTFPKHGADFNFHDPARKFSPETNMIFEGSLNDKGEVSVPLKIKAQAKGPGFLQARMTTRVFEQGGDFSIDQFSVLYHPYDTYVGVRLPKGDEKNNMLLTDTKHKIEILTVDKEGNFKDRDNVEISLYKLDWRWWFDSNKDEVSTWNGNIDYAPVQTAKVKTSGGKATWEMEVKYPEWGRFLVRACDGKGHCSGQVFYIDWPGWAGRSNERDPEGATALQISTDKTKYQVGETVTVNIPTGFAGKALVTLENGSKILQAAWVEQVQQGNARFTFTATKDMAPNVYAYVTLLQPHAQTKNDLPMRMYGAVNVPIEDPTTRLEPTIAVADELEPMKDFTVTVAERKGGPMAYTLAVVDEGLLDLTRFKTPNAWEEFYRREALGVKTWDMYNEVLGAFGGNIKSLLSIGGDEFLDQAGSTKNDRFKPVVLYAGPFFLDKGQTKTHTFKMPNYVGSVRVMVVAANKGAYGNSEKAVPVRQPLMVLGSLPRMLGPDERLRLPVTVFAMDEKVKEATVRIEANGVEIVGDKSRKVAFKNAPGDEMTYFELKTPGRAGRCTVKIIAESGNLKAVYDVDVEIRNPNPRMSNVLADATDAGKSWTAAYKPLGLAGTNTAVLEVSSIPAINLGKRLRYLIQYPYGCVEQTTSSVFPQLFLAKLLPLSEDKKQEIDRNVKAGITRLQQFQVSSGALSYWPGSAEVNEWATNYAGHFLLEAQKAGYTVPTAFMDKWIAYQSKAAKDWSPKGKAAEDLTQAYRLYLLALAGKPEMGAMNRLRAKQWQDNSAAAQWHLAAAYYLAGQKDVANKIAETAPTAVKEYQREESVLTYGSAFRDQALLLQTLSIMGKRNEGAALLKSVCERLSAEQWLSTQETAQALVSVSKFVGDNQNPQKASFEYRIGSGNWTKVSMNTPIWQLSFDGETAASVEFRNGNETLLFPRVIGEGIPAVGNEQESANGLKIEVAFYDRDGKRVQPNQSKQGSDLTVEVLVKNTGKYDYNELALHQVFPSGWEIQNPRLTGSNAGGDAVEYQDFRDDRVYSFFDLKMGETKKIRIRVNTGYQGKYYLPALYAEAMYDPTVQARLKGQWVEVVE